MFQNQVSTQYYVHKRYALRRQIWFRGYRTLNSPVLNFEKTRTEFQEMLAKPIRDLGLKLEGSPLERFVQQLYRELESKGIHKFRPLCYLTDEWGCPSGEPVIGIPFYLANPDLAQLERDMNDLEDAREIMMYMRHEAGHAFNYAYQFYKSAEWHDLFGPFRRAYRDNYRPIPFSRKFVRHMAGWYAQKHPDEDFSETFAGLAHASLALAEALPRLGRAGQAPIHRSHRAQSRRCRTHPASRPHRPHRR